MVWMMREESHEERRVREVAVSDRRGRGRLASLLVWCCMIEISIGGGVPGAAGRLVPGCLGVPRSGVADVGR
ncbi:hypothetical protein MARPU_11650 [Marichromatium purpuratum 984]|uniref:Uncharacterized protein n=1 Tax=Marichromatium purpuratum 984 TaxID=765910 RepID=W0E919_MARPU|nr:hypothetical protein MARPU_11650 [Marichromatium purpuratum 984]